VREEGEYGYFLFPLKFKSFLIKNNRINLNAKVDLPLLRALRGENNASISTDYRGHQVVASWRYIPSTQMGMVVKIDIEEALLSFNKIQWLQGLFLLNIFICVGLSGIYLRRFLIDPLNELVLATHKIAKGDMSQRVRIKTVNEIGRLGQAFNLMVDQVQKAHDTLDQQVQNRTVNLQKAVHLLNEKIEEWEIISTQLKQSMAFQNAILNSNNFCIISTDHQGTIVSFNAAAEKMLGYQASELINQHTPAIFHDVEEVAERAKQLSQELGRQIEPVFEVFIAKTDQGADENEWTYIRKNGVRFPVWLSVTNILDEKKQKIGYLGIASDITERKRIADELLLAYNAIEHTSEGIVITDGDGFISSINPAYTRIMGYEREDVIGRNPNFSKSGRHDRSFYRNMWHKIRRDDCWEGEIWDRRKDGSIFPKWLSINAIRDKQGKVVHYVGIFMDISQQKATEDKLERLAFYDPLTQLPNRALFRERLNQELLAVQRNKLQAALLFIDLDRFKWVNDNLGHNIGDELLIAVAIRITQEIRESDSACRLGGDEFTVILANLTQTDKIGVIAEKIIASLGKTFEINGHQISIGGSIGIAIAPQDGADFDILTTHADMAMYEAKKAGRGMYCFYQSLAS
jgi:diguanylate cyclase (GGDEF)-like protein/PAS domain S-box-containing protein